MQEYEVQLVENIIEIYRGGNLIIAYPFEDEQKAKQFATDLVEQVPHYSYKVN
jgi:hypothetical protein